MIGNNKIKSSKQDHHNTEVNALKTPPNPTHDHAEHNNQDAIHLRRIHKD